MYKQSKEEIKALRERAEAADRENRRRLVDLAKKRAAAQNVDYPTFAAMVSVAHLTPIQKNRADEKKEAQSKWRSWRWSSEEALIAEDDKLRQSLADDPVALKRRQGYERQATLKLLHTIENVAGESNLANARPPLTSDIFIKEWRKLSGNLPLRMRVLRKLSPDDLPRIFKIELPSRILTEILETVRCWQLNGMTCATDGPEAGKDGESCVRQNSDLHGRTWPVSADNLQEPNSTPRPDDLARTLANIKLLNSGCSAPENEQGDPISDRPESQRGDQMASGVTNEVASVEMVTSEEKNQKFKELMRKKKMLWILRVLHCLTKCGRFPLALKMGRDGRATASLILDSLAADLAKESDDDDLESYQKRSHYECRANFVPPANHSFKENAHIDLNLHQLDYLRSIYLHA